MKDEVSELVTRRIKKFLFASGQLLILEDAQIEKIPYLSAIVSAADNFKFVCDEEGHYKLDPYIQFKNFQFVIKSLSFESTRHIFTHLPKEDDVIETIGLFDFLCIGPQFHPTLDEVDSVFFSHLVYSPLLDDYVQTTKPSALQDMAVRFGVALIKEEYDFTNRQVLDRTYWYILFILSAPIFFGSRLRYHIYRIAEYCFSLFSPSLLEPLKRLLWKSLLKKDDDAGPDAENEDLHENQLHAPSWDWFSVSWKPTVYSRRSLLNGASSDYLHWECNPLSEDEFFKPLHNRIVEMMYERLQSEIYRCRGQWVLSHILEHEIVQEEIWKSISGEISELMSKLRHIIKDLIEEMHNYNHISKTSFVFGHPIFRESLDYISNFQYILKKVLFFELMLDKLNQHSSTIEEQIRRNIVETLHDFAIKQMTEWENTQQDIFALKQILSIWRSPENLFQSVFTPIHQKQRHSTKQPFPKMQHKRSPRLFDSFH